MAEAFVNEITKLTREAMAQSNVFYSPSAPPLLPNANSVLYGKDAGTDYAQTVIEELKTAIRSNAKSKMQSLEIRVPSGGEAARQAMENTFRELLSGFDVFVSTYAMLQIKWNHR